MNSVHPECQIHLEIQEEETKCAELLTAHTETHKGKAGSASEVPVMGILAGKQLTPHSANRCFRSPVSFLKRSIFTLFNKLLVKLIWRGSLSHKLLKRKLKSLTETVSMV